MTLYHWLYVGAFVAVFAWVFCRGAKPGPTDAEMKRSAARAEQEGEGR